MYKDSILKKKIYFICFFILSFGVCFGEDYQVIINSQNWEDVYLGALFGTSKGYDYNYLGEGYNVTKFIEILDKKKKIILIEDLNDKIEFGFSELLEGKGFLIEKKFNSNKEENNFDLYEYGDFSKIIFIDEIDFSNVLSTYAYAIKEDAFVIFLNEEIKKKDFNNNKIIYIGSDLSYSKFTFLNNLKVEKSLKSNDKYELNQLIISNILVENSSKNIILSTGDTLEEDILKGNVPVLLIGEDRVPPSVVDFIKDNDIKAGVLLGVENIQSARIIKDNSDIIIVVKISKAILTGSSNQQQTLQRERLRLFKIDLKESELIIDNSIYNKISKKFVVDVSNKGNMKGFFKIHITLKSDEEIIDYIEYDQIKDIELNESIIYKIPYEIESLDKNYDILVQVFYGENDIFLDRVVEDEIKLRFLNILDNSNIKILDVNYNEEIKRFEFKIKNTGEKKVFVKLKIKNLLVDSISESFISDEVLILPKSLEVIKIRVDMTELDFEDNKKIKFLIKYGEQSGSLINEENIELPYTISKNNELFVYVIIGLLAMILILSIIGKNETNKIKSHRSKRRK